MYHIIVQIWSENTVKKIWIFRIENKPHYLYLHLCNKMHHKTIVVSNGIASNQQIKNRKVIM